MKAYRRGDIAEIVSDTFAHNYPRGTLIVIMEERISGVYQARKYREPHERWQYVPERDLAPVRPVNCKFKNSDMKYVLDSDY